MFSSCLQDENIDLPGGDGMGIIRDFKGLDKEELKSDNKCQDSQDSVRARLSS